FYRRCFMRSLRSGYVFPALVAIGAILMLPICGHAQESTVGGTVTDPSGAVIPGVTVTATHTETGNKFEAITDERGDYRLLVRIGNYRITAELPGFGTVNRNIEVLVGQTVVVNIEVIANRFDASQGRTAGMLVNAVTKSGTNTFAGTFAGYFRDDRFNAADFVAKRVLPYSDQQLSGTFGGPIVKDRVHFFGSYEYERQPTTYTYNSPYSAFNIDVHFPARVHKLLGRLDYQFSPATRLSVRASGYNNF